MYCWIAFPSLYLLASYPGVEGSEPALEQHNSNALRTSKATSYITAISIFISVVGSLFLFKWAYVSSRRKLIRRDASQSVWRDEFSGSALPLWRNHSLQSKKHVRSALLVGLFGSPAWETRYSAIADKIPNQRLGQGSLAPTQSSGRYKSISIKSDLNPSLNSIESSSVIEFRDHVDANRHRFQSFLDIAKVPLPTTCFDSGEKRNRHPQETNNPQTTWENEIVSGKHISYPSGLCFKQWRGLDTEAQSTFTSVLTSARNFADPRPDSTQQQVAILRGIGDREETIQHIDYVKSLQAYGERYQRTTLDEVTKDLIGSTSSGSLDLGPLCSTPDDKQEIIQPTSTWISDRAEVLSPTPLRETFDAMDLDYYCSEEKLVALPTTPRLTASLARERVRCRSLRAGPSPLRRMFLPTEPGDIDSQSTLSAVMKEKDSSSPPTYLPSFPEASLKLPQAKGLDIYVPSTPRSAATNYFGAQRSSKPNQEQSDSNLLNLLEELVQETREWHPDMFLNNNFKVMMDSSKSLEVYAPSRTRKKRSAPLRTRRMSYIYLEDIPEVDVTDISHFADTNEDDRSYWSEDDGIYSEVDGVGMAR